MHKISRRFPLDWLAPLHTCYPRIFPYLSGSGVSTPPPKQAALEEGLSVDYVHNLSRIDRWFLCKLRNIAVMKKVCKELNCCHSD